MCHYILALLEFPNPSDFVFLFCRQPQWIRSQPTSWDWINHSYVFFEIYWINMRERESNQNACSGLSIWPCAKFIWGHLSWTHKPFGELSVAVLALKYLCLIVYRLVFYVVLCSFVFSGSSIWCNHTGYTKGLRAWKKLWEACKEIRLWVWEKHKENSKTEHRPFPKVNSDLKEGSREDGDGWKEHKVIVLF